MAIFRTRTLALSALCALAASSTLAQEEEAMARIKDEGMNRSEVMQTLSYLTDVIGPRLTGTGALRRANEWTKYTMEKWGMVNGKLEPWGPFGRGWTLERFSAQVIEPLNIPLIAYPKAWSPSLKGTLTSEVVWIDAVDEAGLQKYKGALKGKIVMSGPIRPVNAHFTPQGTRWTDEQLAAMSGGTTVPRRANPQAQRGGPPAAAAPRNPAMANMAAQFQLQAARNRFLAAEQPALILESASGDGGTIFVQQAAVVRPPLPAGAAAPTGGPGAGGPGGRGGGGGGFTRASGSSPWDKQAKIIPQVAVSVEHYNRMVRMIQAGEPLKMTVELKARYEDKDLMSYNTTAEIEGTDLRDQVVMLGGHLDSWHAGTGATDNGAGCAVAMEAARIIKALGLKPRRTIRVALWSGEEQGLFGSRNYVQQHFGQYVTPPAAAGSTEQPQRKLETKPEYEKISGYFNLDNGTGKIRGIYLQGNAAVGPIFQKWLEPFSDLGAKTVTIRNTGGTDHQSFDGVGIPGFQFIQDEVEYDSRTHHSNQDVYDRIQEDDMKQAAVIMAAFVYQAAMRDDLLPRKTTTR